LGNAVSQSVARDFTRPIRILAIAVGADPVEVANVETALTQELGATEYTVDRDPPVLGNPGLRSRLLGRDVLLINDQNGRSADLHDLGVKWAGALRDFVNNGGVVIVLDGLVMGTTAPSNTCELLSAGELLECGTPIDGTGSLVTDPGSGSPIATGVGDYTGPVNTVQFAQDPKANEIFVVSSSGTYHPVVMDKTFPLRDH